MVGRAGPVRSESARRPQKAVASQRQPTTINEVFPQDRGHSSAPTWDVRHPHEFELYFDMTVTHSPCARPWPPGARWP